MSDAADSGTPQGSTPQTGGSGTGHREVSLRRVGLGTYEVTNPRGGTMTIGGGGTTADFTPVELLLAAIAGCTATDVDHITSRRAVPEEMVLTCSGEKVRSDEQGNLLSGLEVEFRVAFPDGEAGDRAREMLPRAVQRSHDRLCTVSRTVEVGTPIRSVVSGGRDRGVSP